MFGNYINPVMVGALSDELEKIAQGSLIGRAARGFGEALSGSRLSRPVMETIETPVRQMDEPGFLGKLLGRGPTESIGVGTKQIQTGTEKVPMLQALKDESLRPEALKTIGARGAAAGAAGAGAYELNERHNQKKQQRMGRAYISGARDMFARVHGY